VTQRQPRERQPRAGRHPARRVALQTLFEIDFNRADPKETWQRGSFRAGLTETAAAFAWQLIEGTLEHKKELDQEIQQLAPEFPITQMAPVDRNILRIALYELRVLGDAPAAAIIDEAVELAKMFGSEASKKFVNGVLATAVGGRKDAAP
jgi:N utilization substance protein B